MIILSINVITFKIFLDILESNMPFTLLPTYLPLVLTCVLDTPTCKYVVKVYDLFTPTILTWKVLVKLVGHSLQGMSQKDMESDEKLIINLAMFIKIWFPLSTSLFCGGLLGVLNCDLISYSAKKELNLLNIDLPPQLNQSILICLSNRF